MRILVTFAVPSEFAAWRRLRGFDRESGQTVYRSSIGPHIIHVVITGVGARDLTGIQRLFPNELDMCVISGLAGALKNDCPVGSILVAKACKDESTARLAQSHSALLDAAARCGARVVDSICTTNRVVTLSSEKEQMSHMADLVDMESFHVMTLAERFGVPALVLRAVSDGADADLPVDLNRVLNTSGRLRWFALLFELMKAPHRIPAFGRFCADSWIAARRLASFLERFVKSVVLEGSGSLRIVTLS